MPSERSELAAGTATVVTDHCFAVNCASERALSVTTRRGASS